MVTLKHGPDVWTGRCKIVKKNLKSWNIFLVSKGLHTIFVKSQKMFLKWKFVKHPCLLISLKVLDGCLNTPYSVYRYKRQISQENPQNIERIWFGLVWFIYTGPFPSNSSQLKILLLNLLLTTWKLKPS